MAELEPIKASVVQWCIDRIEETDDDAEILAGNADLVSLLGFLSYFATLPVSADGYVLTPGMTTWGLMEEMQDDGSTKQVSERGRITCVNVDGIVVLDYEWELNANAVSVNKPEDTT